MVVIQTQSFDAGELAVRLQTHSAGQAGAYVHFVGTVRDYASGARSRSLFLEHYPGMCEREITTLCEQAAQRWEILDTLIVHRVGELPLGDPIVFVGVASTHRTSAFRACEFLIDALKTRAPFWKRETLQDGRAFWIRQQPADAHKAAQWENQDTATAPTSIPPHA